MGTIWNRIITREPRERRWRGFHRPDELRWEGNLPLGPYTGFPLQKQRRTLHTCYMAGANFVIQESDPDTLLAGYDPLTVDRSNPKNPAPQDEKNEYAGPYALRCADLYPGYKPAVRERGAAGVLLKPRFE